MTSQRGWYLVGLMCRVVMAPVIILAHIAWGFLLAIALSPKTWLVFGLLALSASGVWANTPATTSLPIDSGVDLVIGWLTGKFAWGVGITIIMGAAWRMYSSWGHSGGGEFYGLLFAMVIIAIILNADLVMSTMGAAAELSQEESDVRDPDLSGTGSRGSSIDPGTDSGLARPL